MFINTKTMCEKEQPSAAVDDDVWEDGDDAPDTSQLDREWEARHQQFYNTGYREGLDEGKELTLQHGFNAGFAEGAEAGFEFGLVKGALQTLTALYNGSEEHKAQVQELLQQVSVLPNRTVMRDTCTALLAQPIAGDVAQQLQAAMQQLQLEDDIQLPDPTTTAPAGAAAADAAGSSGSAAACSSAQPELPLPQQLVAHTKQELLKLGFDVGTAPALLTAAPALSTAAPAEGLPAALPGPAAAAPHTGGPLC